MTEYLLKPKEPEITLYKQGFEGVCRLGRSGEGKKLSELVERVSEPMVIAVDAPWGAGKTIFLKCWVGAHELENNGSAKTVFFDAFRDDFMDDPLVGLTNAISERINTEKKAAHPFEKVRAAVSKLAKPTARIGLAVTTSGISEVAGPIVDAALEAGSKELAEASKEFWKKEDGKRAAMASLRAALEEVAETQKLVIVVDELDRCRPDYALNLLEIVKHFFDVKNVHFVLGVNLKELANSVRVRYGAGVEADRYLQKFVTLSMPLIPREAKTASLQTQVRHFNRVAEEVGLSDYWKRDVLAEYLGLVDHHAGLSLRDVERIVTLAMVTPAPKENPSACGDLYAGAVVLKIVAPELFEKARRGKLTADDVFSVFRLRDRNDNIRRYKTAYEVWNLVARSGETTSLPNYLLDRMDGHFSVYKPDELLRKVIKDTLDVFVIDV